MNRGEVDEAELKERQARAMADPEVQGILTDPVMRQASRCTSSSLQYGANAQQGYWLPLLHTRRDAVLPAQARCQQ